jgi:RNA polymerase sigma-70 factor (ECF subfamily)
MRDQQALQQYAASQDAQAFRVLVDQYQLLVYSAARRRLAHIQDIEDVVQITFLKLARAAGTIKRNLAAWLYTTTLNTANELIRRDAARRRHEALAAADPSSSYLEDQHEWRDLSLLLDEALLQLPDEQQLLLIEHFLRGRSQRELAAELELSQSTIMRRINIAVDELRSRLADLGYVGATPMLASTLQNLPQGAIPAYITTQLNKIGLAGPSAAAAPATSLLSASLPLKLALAAGAVAVLVTGAVILLPSQPPTTPGLAATVPVNAPESAPANAADWRTTFNEAYALAPNQNLKFIPPGQFPERKRYFSEVERNDSPMPCIQWRWIDGTLKREAMHGPGPAGAQLSTILRFCANLDTHHAPTAGLPPINLNGDWIVRDGASIDAILADLHAILLDQFKTDIRFEKTETIKDALVATGKYQFRRLPEATSGGLQIFADTLDHPRPGDSVQGGGTTPPAYLWALLGETIAFPIIDETTGEPAKISWLLSRSIQGADQQPARRQQILDNITRQTGIIFKQERRPFITWKLTSPTEKPPTEKTHIPTTRQTK